MKNILSLSAAIGLFISSSAIAGPVCERIFSETALVESGMFADMQDTTPGAAKVYRDAVIESCESASRLGAKGLGPEVVAHMTMLSTTRRNSIDSLLSATRVTVVMTGWAVGAEKAKL